MSSQAGTVTYVKVYNGSASGGGNFCLFGLDENNGSTEHILLWFASAGSQATAEDWVLRNAQIALLRDAFVNKLPIVVFFDDRTSLVTGVQLGAIASGEPFV